MSPPVIRPMQLMDWGLLLLLSTTWGTSYFFGKIALAQVPPLTLVLARVSLAAAALAPAIVLTGRRWPRGRSVWAAFGLMGLFNNLLPFGLIFWAMTQMPSGLAAALTATTPFWAMLLAHVFTADERLTATRLVGVVLGFAGVVIVLGGEGWGGSAPPALAGAAVVLGAISYAGSGIYGRRLASLPPLVAAACQFTASAAMTLPLALVVDRPWRVLPALTPATWGALLGLAFLGTACGTMLYFRLLATSGATAVALVKLLTPVTALALGMLVLGETLAAAQGAGIVLIGLGLAVVDGRSLAWCGRRRRGAGRNIPLGEAAPPAAAPAQSLALTAPLASRAHPR